MARKKKRIPKDQDPNNFTKIREEHEMLRELFRNGHPEEGVNARLPSWMKQLHVPEWEDNVQ